MAVVDGHHTDAAAPPVVHGQPNSNVTYFSHSIKFFLPSLYLLHYSHDLFDKALYPKSFASGSSKVTNCVYEGGEPGDEATREIFQ